MTFIDESKPLRNMLLEDDHDDLEFHPPQTRRDGAGSWQRKRRNYAFNEALAPDPKIDRIRDVWTRGNLFEEGGDAWFKTRAGVGLDDVNGQFDMAKTETLLEQAGALDLADTKGPTGLFSYHKEDAIKDFQASNALKVDGRIAPNGETMRALKAQLTPKLVALAKAAKAAEGRRLRRSNRRNLPYRSNRRNPIGYRLPSMTATMPSGMTARRSASSVAPIRTRMIAPHAMTIGRTNRLRFCPRS